MTAPFFAGMRVNDGTVPRAAVVSGCGLASGWTARPVRPVAESGAHVRAAKGPAGHGGIVQGEAPAGLDA